MTNSKINFFNRATSILFQELSDIKYTMILCEINQEEKFIGISLRTDNLIVNITILTPDNFSYFKNKNCSCAIYDIEDTKMWKPMIIVPNISINQCAEVILDEDIDAVIHDPKFNYN